MELSKFLQENINECTAKFTEIDAVSLHNQQKVLSAFEENRVALRHFNGSSGYGYGDIGRETLCKIFADVFGTEDAIVSPNVASGTHAIVLALFGLLRPNDLVLSISGKPYDTLDTAICGKGVGSLADYGVKFEQVELKDEDFDFPNIDKAIRKYSPTMIYIQRSRGYEWRSALSIAKIEKACKFIKNITNATIVVDNCYGEFVEKKEPTNVGADVCIGSLIKNIGGGISPTGGYIVGDKKSIENISYRLTAPGIGSEVGSYELGYRMFYQGLFVAPHTVGQALKTGVLFSHTLSKLGYAVKPTPNEQFFDIVCSVKFNQKDKLVRFVQSVQECSPVDSFAVPEPSDMPGYSDQVIMAAGCFVQGASIELSCDAPIRPPYIAYFQGGLTLEHGIIVLEKIVEKLCN